MRSSTQSTRRVWRRPVAARVLLVGLTGIGVAGLLLAAGETAQPPPAPPAPPAPEGFRLRGEVERGRTLFAKSCASCHGETGAGDGRIALDPPARDLRDAERMGERSDWEVYLVIRDGGKALGLSPKMIPWGSLLDEQQLHDAAAFVRSLAAAERGDRAGG